MHLDEHAGEHRKARVKKSRKAGWRRYVFLSAMVFAAPMTTALADPTLPTIGSTVYNVTVSNSSIDGGATAVGNGTTDDTAVLNAFISYASSHGGGTVEVPASASAYMANQINMQSGVNLQVDGGATLQNITPLNTFITCSGSPSNIEISGSGILNDNGTTSTGSHDMVLLNHVTNLEVKGVTIENGSHEHLVTESDTNVTINGITIKAPLGFLANADGIDYSGNHFLIENSNIADGDDDIVAKPSAPMTDITITNCSIGAGHGISIGGGLGQGVTNMTVSHITFNGTSIGLRIKAQDVSGSDSGGGLAHPAQGITYSNITMTNVASPIVLDSFYNGGNNFPSSPTDSTHYPSTPTNITADASAPVMEDILFQNITATGASNGGQIFGLNSSPANISGLTFSNVNITASTQMEMWYVSDVNFSGLTVNVPSSNKYFHASPVSGVFMFDVTPAPEPATLGFAAAGLCALVMRRPRRSR